MSTKGPTFYIDPDGRAWWHEGDFRLDPEGRAWPRKRDRKQPPQCIEARKQRGNNTRNAILKEWQRLSHMSKRERAAKIPARLNLSEQHVRLVLRTNLK